MNKESLVDTVAKLDGEGNPTFFSPSSFRESHSALTASFPLPGCLLLARDLLLNCPHTISTIKSLDEDTKDFCLCPLQNIT